MFHELLFTCLKFRNFVTLLHFKKVVSLLLFQSIFGRLLFLTDFDLTLREFLKVIVFLLLSSSLLSSILFEYSGLILSNFSILKFLSTKFFFFLSFSYSTSFFANNFYLPLLFIYWTKDFLIFSLIAKNGVFIFIQWKVVLFLSFIFRLSSFSSVSFLIFRETRSMPFSTFWKILLKSFSMHRIIYYSLSP